VFFAFLTCGMQGNDILKAELKQAIAECERLRSENFPLPTSCQNSAKPVFEGRNL
jgi:hypothetical protein